MILVPQHSSVLCISEAAVYFPNHNKTSFITGFSSPQPLPKGEVVPSSRGKKVWMRGFSNKMLLRHGDSAPLRQDERSITKLVLGRNNGAPLSRFNVLVHPKKIIRIKFILDLH